MSLPLDTHVVLWWLADDPGLAEEIKDRLDHEPDVRVSVATIWEIAIMIALPGSYRLGRAGQHGEQDAGRVL
jgi:PIN domain nuclease of toxin-antitoxin system